MGHYGAKKWRKHISIKKDGKFERVVNLEKSSFAMKMWFTIDTIWAFYKAINTLCL